MPDDRATLTEMLEQVAVLEDQLGKLKSSAKSRAILERLRKLREDLSEMIAKMKTK